jgi:hypothetical protein
MNIIYGDYKLLTSLTEWEGLMKMKLEIPVMSAFQPELVEFYYLWKKTPGANNNRPHRRNRRQQSLRRIRNTRNTRGGQPKEADANSPAGICITTLLQVIMVKLL